MVTIGTLPSPLASATRPARKARGIEAVVVQAMVRAVTVSVKSLIRWHEIQRQKQALCSLDARLLDDIGLSAQDVKRAFAPSIWDRLGL